MSIDYDHFDFEISKCARYDGVHPGAPASLGMAKSPRCRGGIWRSSLSYKVTTPIRSTATIVNLRAYFSIFIKGC